MIIQTTVLIQLAVLTPQGVKKNIILNLKSKFNNRKNNIQNQK